jgi:AraC-like DNA-binding protein
MSDVPATHGFHWRGPLARVLDPARWSVPPGWDQETRIAPHYELGYVAEGTGWWHLDARVLRQSAGQAYLTCPGAYSRMRVPSGGPDGMRGWKITFEWPCLEPRRGGDGDLALADAVIVPAALRRRLDDSFAAVQALFLEAAPGWELEASGHLQVLLARIARCAAADAGLPRALNRRLAASIEFMRSHLRRPFKIAAAAAAAGLSEDYYRRVFQQALGMGPSQYLQQLRLGQARRLLAEDPETSVVTTARAAGFGDAKHFARLFRRRFGVGPRDFRRQLRHLRHGR